MANDIKLQEGHPVDENLRPIKVGGKATAIETAQHGNGAKVNGDLEVTGDITGNVKDITFDSIVTNSIVSDHLTINDISHVTIVPEGNFNVDASTSIVLDSETGAFIAKKAGTEFSVANSSYAGMILGYTTVGIDAADDSYTLTATMATIDDALKVKFVAPPSGVVEIFAQIYFDASRRFPVLGLSDANATTGYSGIDFPNANDTTNEHLQAAPPTSGGDSVLRPHWVVAGLTSGTAYEWWLAAKTLAGVGGALKWGGNISGEFPPFIMRATALPTAVVDYAVYG